MAAAQAGDASAYRTLLQSCIPAIRAVVRGSGVPANAVDDAIQECLIAIHGARHTYDPARPFLPWLRSIARRRAIDALRQGGRRDRREIYDPIAYDNAPDQTNDPSHGVETADRKRVLNKAVSALPAAQREAVEQLAFADRSLSEAAAATGRSTVSLKVNFHRALQNLKARLSSTGDRGE
jgi:RNA polymerase sigma-70 factor (ECF subfamily)